MVLRGTSTRARGDAERALIEKLSRCLSSPHRLPCTSFFFESVPALNTVRSTDNCDSDAIEYVDNTGFAKNMCPDSQRHGFFFSPVHRSTPSINCRLPRIYFLFGPFFVLKRDWNTMELRGFRFPFCTRAGFFWLLMLVSTSISVKKKNKKRDGQGADRLMYTRAKSHLNIPSPVAVALASPWF